MTGAEVCAVAGGPPGDYSDGRVVPDHPRASAAPWSPNQWEVWVADDGELLVLFDGDGRAADSWTYAT